MEYETAIATLKAHETELKQLGVEHLYLFGSTARGEARDDSDVDLFFDHERGKLSLFDLMEVKEQAERILGRRTDIMTRRSLLAVQPGCGLVVCCPVLFQTGEPGLRT